MEQSQEWIGFDEPLEEIIAAVNDLEKGEHAYMVHTDLPQDVKEALLKLMKEG